MSGTLSSTEDVEGIYDVLGEAGFQAILLQLLGPFLLDFKRFKISSPRTLPLQSSLA